MRVHPISLALRCLQEKAAPGRPAFASKEEAVAALCRLTGQDFGLDAKAWGAWLRKNRRVYYRLPDSKLTSGR